MSWISAMQVTVVPGFSRPFHM